MMFSLLCLPVLAQAQSNEGKAAKTESSAKLVNINSALVPELETLPRIGVKIAERIVQYRKDNGPFKRKQDIMKVKGIGEKVYALLETRICI